jgi:hypothetical protein
MVRGLIVAFLALNILITTDCARRIAPAATKDETYEEDLTGYRPPDNRYVSPERSEPVPVHRSNVEPELDVTDEVNVILDSMYEINKRTQFPKFTIQIHNSNIRELADSARIEVYRILPAEKPVLEFIAPSYRVKVGSYYNQLEAYQTLLKLKEHFPNAIIVPESVYFK